jgi:phage gp29-like protein
MPKATQKGLKPSSIGKSVNAGTVLQRSGAVSGSPGQMVNRANRWREQYNPLRGLSLPKAVAMFESQLLGDLPELMWTYHFIERRHPVLRAGIQRRRAALLKLDFEIRTVETKKLPKGFTQAQADAQAQILREAYDQVDDLKAAIRHLALAEFRGFSILQKHYGESGQVTHLEILNHWNFAREGLFGDFFWNATAQSCASPAQTLGEANRIGGDALPRTDFVLREVDMPINEIGLLCAIRRGLSQKDWDAFVEIYGLPGGVVTMPQNVPAGKEEEYAEKARQIAEGGSGSLPNGSTYTPNDSPRGTNPFKEHKKDLDEDLVLAITSGKLTMLAESGSGNLAGGAHQDSFDDVAQAEAAEISEVFQIDFDAPILEQKCPGQPVLAYFQICASDDTDVNSLVKNVAALGPAGYTADVAWLNEKTGYQLTVAPIERVDVRSQELPPSELNRLAGLQRILNRSTGSAPSDFYSGLASDLHPLAQRLQRVLAIQDPDLFRQKLQELNAELDQLSQDILADPRSARALERITSSAAVDALQQATKERQ